MKVLRKCFRRGNPGYTYARAGFSLVELSMVVLIIGVLVGGAVAVGISRTEAAKATANAARMDRVEEAIIAFVNLNRYMPCPAVASLAMTNAAFGVSDCAATCTGAPRYVCVGMLPVTTLNGADDMALDGWNNRFTYAVDQRLTNMGATANNGPANFRDTNTDDGPPFDAVYDPVIAINNATLATNTSATGIWIADLAGTERTDDAAMALVSHGPNGRCARTRAGTLLTCAVGANTQEQENGDGDRGFQQSAGRQAIFDDVVHYLFKWQIVRRVGGVVDTALCERAARITECEIRNIAAGAGVSVPTGPVGCNDETIDLDGNPAAPHNFNQHLGCTSTQMELARAIVSRCFMDLSYVCRP